MSQYWPILRDIGAFALGVFILLWQTVWEDHAQAILVGAGFAALGITGSGIAQRWIRGKLDAFDR